jgi:hypothetical protein
MRERNPWNSDFTGIFEERKIRDAEQRIKDVMDIKKGLGGDIGEGLGVLAGEAAAGPVGAVVGGAAGKSIGGSFDKEEKMKKAEPIDNYGSIENANEARSKELGYEGSKDYMDKNGSYNKQGYWHGNKKMAKAAPIKLPTAYKESNSELKSLIKSIDRVLKSMGEAPNAGLKTKKVTQGKDGKSFPTKNVPKPTTKKSC